MNSATIQRITSFTKILIERWRNNVDCAASVERLPSAPLSGQSELLVDHQRSFFDRSLDLGSAAVCQRIIVDLRSPAEFARGAIPRSINIPLLDNDQRRDVGICYKHQGSEEAIALGLSIFEQKSNSFITQLQSLPKDRPLHLYCWRGGLRSQSVAFLMTQLGRSVVVYRSGYKGFRAETLKLIEEFSCHPMLVLSGRTGVGKTHVIGQLQELGLGAIDLEGLARHRGSAFGSFDGCDPLTQQDFENRLASDYFSKSHHTRLAVELESALGPIKIPQRLRQHMMVSPVVNLKRDFYDRVNRIVSEYTGDWGAAKEDQFCSQLQMVRKHIGDVSYRALLEAVKASDLEYVARTLIRERYDRMYDRGIRRYRFNIISSFNLTRDYEAMIEFLTSELGGYRGPGKK